MGQENYNSEVSAAVNAPGLAFVPPPAPDNAKPNFKQRLRGLWSKLTKSPLFAGNRKFITLPILTLALVAIIVVPILIFSSLRTAEPGSDAWFVDVSRNVNAIADERGVDAGIDEPSRPLC